jgi:hypothetical protein
MIYHAITAERGVKVLILPDFFGIFPIGSP